MADYRKLMDEIFAAHGDLDDWDDPASISRFAPATDAEVAAAELRLQCRFPGSYRQFLLDVNGCPKLGIAFGGLLPVDQVQWFAESEPQWVEAYMAPAGDLADISEEDHVALADDCVRFRRAYLPHLLKIGESYDGSVYLLNPLVKTASGEWEAWSFANWFPGATRARSFEELVRSEHRAVLNEVHLRSIQVDEDAILAKAIPILRDQISRGESPSAAVAMYLTSESQNDEMFAAWMRTKQPYYALLKALGLHS